MITSSLIRALLSMRTSGFVKFFARKLALVSAHGAMSRVMVPNPFWCKIHARNKKILNMITCQKKEKD